MNTLTVNPINRLEARFSVPGDKSMSHRAAILAGMASGTSLIHNFLPSEDCLNTLKAMLALGVRCEVLAEMEGFGPVQLRIEGCSMAFSAPQQPIDCGNSGTGMRLLAGMLAAQPFESELFGDASLSSRPMARIMTPLAQMGANIEALGEKPGCAPLKIRGGELQPICYEMPVASAQVKSAVLLAGLFTRGKTSVRQPAETRDHTERMLAAFGAATERVGQEISINGPAMPVGREFHVPGDVSSAAFWLVAAAALPGSDLTIVSLGLNPTRTAVIDVLRRMGAEITVEVTDEQGGEPIGWVRVRGRGLTGTDIVAAEVPNLIDEVPVLAVAAALARGVTRIRDAKELRVKETDRIATVVENLQAMGAQVLEFEDGMEISGPCKLMGAELQSFGDHRIAMAFAIAGLFAEGQTVIHGTDCINTSYPGFSRQLQAVLAESHHDEDYQLPMKWR